jgi:hypothetical protein
MGAGFITGLRCALWINKAAPQFIARDNPVGNSLPLSTLVNHSLVNEELYDMQRCVYFVNVGGTMTVGPHYPTAHVNEDFLVKNVLSKISSF